MYELPLFPLNTVLFPNTPIHLHIFEERYKQMISHCVENRQPFGVVLIRRGMEALGPLAEPHRIGVAAQIVHVQHLTLGRMNIVAMGEQRFRVLSLEKNAYPYLVGVVEDYPILNPDPEAARLGARSLKTQVRRFVQGLMDASPSTEQFDLEQIPDDPLTLAYVSAALLQIPPHEKQELLAQGSAVELLDSLQDIYRRELALLPALRSQSRAGLVGSFSKT
jgi:Lon protease-like protein